MLLDTNVLVRHLTGKPRDHARRATALLTTAQELQLAPMIVAELVYVLESVYDVPPPQIASYVRSVLAHPPIRTDQEQALLRSIELYETHGLDFADAYLAALAEASGQPVASFDRDFDRIPTITRHEP